VLIIKRSQTLAEADETGRVDGAATSALIDGHKTAGGYGCRVCGSWFLLGSGQALRLAHGPCDRGSGWVPAHSWNSVGTGWMSWHVVRGPVIHRTGRDAGCRVNHRHRAGMTGRSTAGTVGCRSRDGVVVITG
jgi:hypothetical protein